jgi:hypothetical protein
MFLTVADGPAGYEESAAIDAQGANLAALVKPYAEAVETILINGRLVSDWRNYIPQKSDRVRLGLKTGVPLLFFVPYLGAMAATTAAIVSSAIAITLNIAISMAIGMAVRALTPNPKAPKLDGSGGQAFGVTGFTNTTGQGTPIPVWYGEQRVWGHVIASGAHLSADYTTMIADVLYCLGDSGGDEYEAIYDVLIDRVPANQYQGVVINTRLGSLTQTVIPEFNQTRNLFVDGRTLPYDDNTEVGTTIPYITHGNNVNVVKLILQFPAGLWRSPPTGMFTSDVVELRIDLRRVGYPDYVVVPSPSGLFWHIEDAIRSAFFRDIYVQTSMVSLEAATKYWADRPDVAADPYHGSSPAAAFQHYIQFGQFEGSIWHDELAPNGQWDLKITINSAHVGNPTDAHATTVILFNVEEISYASTNYPGYVLLGITGLQGNQVRNLQALEVSAFVKGKKCKDPVVGTLGYTRARTLIVRDLMTHPVCGMGYEFSEAEIDDAQWHFDSLAYYDESVPAQGGGTEQRDVCDVGITERRWDWDWVKRVASEGRAAVFPSGLKWKYVIDKPGTPNMLLAEPGNIIEGSISMEISPPDDPYNQIVGQFRDAASDYTSELSQPIDSVASRTSINQKVVAYETLTRESEVLRENMIQMKRQDLERRRFSFVSPSSQLTGEPFDIDWLSERTIGDIGAYAGVLPAGCTLGTLNLPYAIDLDVGKNYLAIIQHKGMSLCETRLLSTGAGRWSQVGLATVLNNLPEEGAVFAIGVELIDHIKTRARDFQIDDQGHITQLRTEYIEEVYNPDALPAGLDRKRFPLSLVPPIPIREASVQCQVVQRRDGSWGAVILFDITRGLAVHGGYMSANAHTAGPLGAGITDVNTTVIVLDINEPRQAEQTNYYRGAYLLIADGAFHDQERKILYYDALSRSAACEEFTGLPTTGTTYRIRWTSFSETYGFKVEQSDDRINWVELARPVGMHWEKDGGDQGGTWYHKFTPYNSTGVYNNFAPLIRGPITFFGDTTPPDPPSDPTGHGSGVEAWGVLKTVTIQATFKLPTSLDLAAIEAVIVSFDFLTDAQGNTYRGNLIGYAQARAGTSAALVGQTSNVRMVFDLSNNPPPYGKNLYATVRSIDYSGNMSGYTQSNDFQLQKITDADIV